MSMAAMRLVNALVCHDYSATRDNFAYCSSSCCDRNDAAASGCHNYTDRSVAVYLVAVVYPSVVVGPFSSSADATTVFIARHNNGSSIRQAIILWFPCKTLFLAS